jgi:hypothetical protein
MTTRTTVDVRVIVTGFRVVCRVPIMLHQADTGARLRAISIAGVDPVIPVPNNAGVRVVRRVVRIAVVAQAQSDTCERQTPAPAAPAPTKATTTEAGHANWAAEAGAGDPDATEAASANRAPSEAADRSASEAAATDASAEAGPDRSATETTTTYCRSPKATADCAPAETATHPTAPETAAHPAAVETSHPATAHSSTTALRRSHVRKESGRNQRCRTENTNLIHGRLLDSSLQMPP